MKFFLLDKQQNIIGRLSEEYILEATFTEEINTAGELLITLPAKKRLSGNVIHILITNPSKDHSYLMFKIIKETVKDEEVEYTAVESAYDELTSYGYIQDKRPTANAQTITEMILKDTRWHVGEIPDTSEAFISFYYLSVLDCLKKIVQTFDFEIGFDVLINDAENQITDRRVNFCIKQGEQTGKRFEYGSNLLSIKQEQDTQNIYTALVGRGKGVQVSGGDDDNTPDGYGRRITFADVEWSKTNGDPLDKPKGQEWLEDPDATKQLGFSDGHMRIGLEVFEDVDDPKVLLQKTYEALKTAERPQVQFSASVINTGELHLGDRVGITRNDIGIAYETRVFKVQHNLLDETQNKIDLGDNLEQTNNLSYQVSALQSEVTNNTEDIITVTQSANGKNKVYYSSTMPATGSNGDVWYKDLGNGETEMYIYDNGWQLVISTENLHKIEDEIKQQQTALDKAVQDANAASAKADGLVAQVGDANTNAQKALTTAQQNQADLAQAKNDLENTKNQLTNVQSDLTGTKSSLAGAISNISQAQEDLKNTEQGLQGVKSDLANDEKNLSGLTKQAQAQGQTIVDIQKTQSGLSADIADVKGNVSSLQDTANSLQATVKDNQGNISKMQDTANSLQSSITDNKNNIASIKQTAGSIQSTVASMQNAGENLIVNSDFEQGGYHWNLNGWQISNDDEFRNHKIISKTQNGLGSANYNEFSATDLIPVQKGQTISIGVWVKASNVDSSGDGNWGATFGVNWYADNKSGRNHWTDFNDRTYYGNHDWRFLKMEGLQPPADSNFARAHFFLTQNGTAQFALPIMVYGDKLPAWSPSPLDSATATDMSSVEQTVNGLKSTVQSNKGDISTLKQTASGLESDVQNNKNSISTIKQSADKVQSIVSNMKVGGTNLLPETQNYTGYIRWGGTEIIDDYSCNDYQFKPQTKIIHLYQTNGNHSLDNAMPTPDNKPVHIIQGKQYTFSAYVWHYGDTGQANELVTLYANNGNSTLELGTVTTTLTNQAVLYHFTFTAMQTGDYTRFRVVHRNNCDIVNGSMFIAEMKLEEGNVATDWSPSPYDMASQDDLSSVEQTVSGLTSTVQSHSGQISQVKQTADSLQSSITQGIGSYLPNGDFADSNVSKYWVPWDTTKDLSEVFVVPSSGTKDMPPACLKIQTKSSENKTDIGTKDYIPFNINEPIEIKAWSWLNASNSNTQFQFYIHCYDENHNEVDSGSGYFKYDNLNEWELTDVTFNKDQWNKNTVSMRLEVVLFGGGIDTAGYITGLKIINGSSGIASQFTQTIDSLSSKIADADGNISQLKQTSDSLTSQIGNANNDISSLKQRADSMESNISDNKNDISDLRQTANSLQSNIQSKADISQITQLSNAIQSVVQSVGSFFPNGNFADSNVQVYWSPWDITKDYTNINYDAATYNGSFGNLMLHASGGGWTKAISTEYIPIQPSKSVTVSLASRGDWYGNNGKPKTLQCYVHFYDSKKNETASGSFDLNCSNNQQWYDNSAGYDCASNECYIRVEICLQGNQENWAHITNVKVSSDGGESISSKISQMSDDINMRVQKGNLLSQINIQAGSTLIQSNKLYLDASSVVFSGNAFIPSAAITDLSADKITAGTLNAGNVNIINLDVNKLVGNTTEFVRSGWTNAYGSHVQIDGGGMSITYGDWLTKFEPDGMVFRDGNEDIGGFTRIGMQGAPSWYGGLAFNAGGDAEFLSIGAKDYHNDSQNPVPAKLLWMRKDINTYGYHSGWNFCDDVWAGQVSMSSIQYDDWNIHFEKVSGNDGFSALTLVSGSGNGFYWGSDGSFGYVTNHGGLHNVRGSQIVYDINQNGGTCQSWSGVD